MLTADTTNNRVQVGNGSSGTLKVGDSTVTKASGADWVIASALKVAGYLQLALTSKTDGAIRSAPPTIPSSPMPPAGPFR